MIVNINQLDLSQTYFCVNYLTGKFDKWIELIKDKILEMSNDVNRIHLGISFQWQGIINHGKIETFNHYPAYFHVRFLLSPDMVVELLSTGNHHPDISDKFEMFQQTQVVEYRIVDPNNEFVIVYNFVKGKYSGGSPYSGDVALKSKVLKDLKVNVSEIFDIN